jgi:acetyl esterase/lipase
MDRTDASLHIPCWVFHGERDPFLPAGQVRETVAVLRNAGANVRYSELPKATHRIWPTVYTDPKLYRWLAQQRKETH